MTYEELKKIAQPHIREKDNLPSNSFLLLTQLHIPYKTEKQCKEDFEGKYNPLDNCPAFLYITGDEKILYFKTTTRYWNFYVFHEIAHYLLGHEDSTPQNELDANLLACILVAPIENFPTTIKTAQDLSSICIIPIDRAEEYWAEIKNKAPHNNKKSKNSLIFDIICFGILGILLVSLITYSHFNPKEQNSALSIPSVQTPTPVHSSTEQFKQNSSKDQVFVTISGDKYHEPDCPYVKYKNNLVQYNINEAERRGYVPCKKCN